MKRLILIEKDARSGRCKECEHYIEVLTTSNKAFSGCIHEIEKCPMEKDNSTMNEPRLIQDLAILDMALTLCENECKAEAKCLFGYDECPIKEEVSANN